MKRILSLVVVVLGLIVAGVAYTYDDVDSSCFMRFDDNVRSLAQATADSGGAFQLRRIDIDNNARPFPVVGGTCKATSIRIGDDGTAVASAPGETTFVDWPRTAATIAGLLLAALGLAGYSRWRSGGRSPGGVRTGSAGSQVDPPSRQQMLSSVEERLDILTAVDAALEWRRDVVRVVEDAADPDAARSAVKALLQVSDMGANAVLAMQLRRFTVSERAAIREEVTQLQDEHRQLSG
ncbi:MULTISPECIES: DNA gyrase subunit A [Nocardiaceae]|uniref:DNA topoisomerase (ATP-hydrolyzing) n=1 Tax=Rhodococcoides corynebacterioides TaxID=53972 RepID=A0ABS2KUA6_9NOCA|nr:MULTISPECIES: DNA gyrase subunit A [Rhodococcus]MBM7415523.1 hypothetical protein [Rhodococcus corynebacterioides]MBP1117985.1 hypothetical protein [Rhodococcus sp. PvP016]